MIWRDPSVRTTTMDMTFANDRTGRHLSINTFHPLSDGRRAPKREREAASRAVHNGSAGDIVAILPLPRNGESYDEERFGEMIRPLLEEMDRPPPAEDPRENTPLDRLWYLWEPDD